MLVWLQRATLAGELVCVAVTDVLLRACACPVGGVQVAGRATGLEAWDGDVSPAWGWGIREGGELGLGHPAHPRPCDNVPPPASPLALQTRAAGRRLSQNSSFVSDPKSRQAANGLPPQTRTPWAPPGSLLLQGPRHPPCGRPAEARADTYDVCRMTCELSL